MDVERMAEYGRRALVGTFWALLTLTLVLGLGQVAGRWLVIEVQGGSMQGAIANGAALLTTPLDVDQVHPGDVVSMVGEGGSRVTHRVVAINEHGELITRGDANLVDDSMPYASERVDLVRVVAPGMGLTIRLLTLLVRNPWIVGGCGLAVVLALLPRGRSHRENQRELAVQL